MLFFCLPAQAQERKQALATIKKLCSKKMAGRGYVKDGMGKAARYIARRLDKSGVQPVQGMRIQQFQIPVNTFPGKVYFTAGQKGFRPGYDYLVNADCPSVKTGGRIFYIDSRVLHYSDTQWMSYKAFLRTKIAVLDTLLPDKSDVLAQTRLKEIEEGIPLALVRLINQLPAWTVATEQAKLPVIWMKRQRWFAGGTPAADVHLEVESRFYEQYTCSNVLGMVPGKKHPDSLLVLCAHYDHLGMMGKKTLFPGANDNAGGVALLLDLADYYAKHPADYSIAFLFFGAEEAGILGSYYFVNKPAFPLHNISFLTNLDLVTSGGTGMTVVNGSVFKRQFALLDSVNKKGSYLPQIRTRGKAANSDHYFFTEQGVPSFFFYLSGEYKEYHNVQDRWNAIPLDHYPQTFRLVTDFLDALQNR